MKRTTVLAAAVLVALGSPVHAATPAPTAERIWAKGVSPADQQKALALFKDGNALLKDSVFVQAAAKYREALSHWDHPAIHYNLVLALLNLDQPIEVQQHLVAAMKYGPEPLDKEKYEQAKAHKIVIEAKLARVQITCEEPGAQVKMDGRPLFMAPGKYEAFVRPGPHTIVATKEGFLTNEVSRALPAGETVNLDLKLMTAADLTEYRRKWSVWMPWTVVGAGALVAVVGGGLHYGGAEKVREFDAGVESCGGCVPSEDLSDARRTGGTMQKVAVTSYAAGGAALITGAVLVYMNRLQAYAIEKPSKKEPGAPGTGSPAPATPAEPAIGVAPMLGETRGVSASFRF